MTAEIPTTPDMLQSMIDSELGAAVQRPAPSGYAWKPCHHIVKALRQQHGEPTRAFNERMRQHNGCLHLVPVTAAAFEDAINGDGPCATLSAIDGRPVSLATYQAELDELRISREPRHVADDDDIPENFGRGNRQLIIVTGPDDDRPDDGPPRPYRGASSGRIVRT